MEDKADECREMIIEQLDKGKTAQKEAQNIVMTNHLPNWKVMSEYM